MHSIILIEDHPIVRIGIQTLINKSEKFFIDSFYESGSAGLQAIKLKKPDFAIIDLNLPDLPGESIIRDLFLNSSKTKIIVLSSQKYIPQISHLLKMNIFAYIIKESAGRELLKSLEEALVGKVYLSPSIEILLKKMKYLPAEKSGKNLMDVLSEREIEIARLLCKGFDAVEISSKLSISKITVRVHTKNILKKMNLENLKALLKIPENLF